MGWPLVTAQKKKARLVSFWVKACPVTGDPGCLDCTEGICAGTRMPWSSYRAHQCTECRGHDVYGEMYHEPECSLYVAPSEVPL